MTRGGLVSGLGFAVIIAAAAPGVALAQVPKELQDAMLARDKAAAAKDAATWDGLTAEDFSVVLGDGVRRNKAERLAHLKSQQPTPWVPPEQETIALYGDVAVQRFRSGATSGRSWCG